MDSEDMKIVLETKKSFARLQLCTDQLHPQNSKQQKQVSKEDLMRVFISEHTEDHYASDCFITKK